MGPAKHTGETGTFSREAGNPGVAREYFCNEVLGWLFAFLTRLCRSDKLVGKRHSLETEESITAAHSRKRRACIHICALFTTVCRQLKQSLLQREQRYFGP